MTELQEFANTRPALRGMDVAHAFAALASARASDSRRDSR